MDEQTYQLALGAAKICIWEWEPASDVITWSGCAPDLLGTPHVPTSLGQFVLERVHPDDQQSVRGALRRAVEFGAPIELRYRVVMEGGSQRSLLMHIQSSDAGEDSARSLVGTLQDWTKQRDLEVALRSSESEYRMLFADSPRPMWIYDRETLRFLEVNDAALAQYGYSRREFMESTIYDIRPAAEHQRLGQNLATTRLPIEQSGPWLHRRNDGTTLEVEIDSHVITWGGRDAALVAVHDVTERNRMARENRQFNTDLQILLHAAQDLGRDLRQSAVYSRTVEAVVKVLPDVDLVSLILFDAATGEANTVAEAFGGEIRVIPENSKGDEQFRRLSPDVVERLLQSREPVRLDSGTVIGIGPESTPVTAAAAIPLLVEDAPVGTLVASRYSASSPIGDRDIRLLQTLASHSAVAIKNADMLRHIRRIPHELIQAQEDERRRLAHELHDEVGAQLTALTLCLTMIDPSRPDENSKKSLKQAEELVNGLADEVRGMALRLRPSVLDDLGLWAALRWFVNRYETQTCISIDFQNELDPERRYPPTVEITAFRIVQESLTNVARHARASRVHLSVSAENDRLRIDVADAGLGFDYEKALKRRQSVGLIGMQERVALLNGRIEINSAPGEGTRVSVVLPIAE